MSAQKPKSKGRSTASESMDYARQVERLNQIGIALSSVHDLDKLLKLILKEARSFTKADAGSLYIVEGDRLTIKVTQNATLDRRQGPKYPFQSFSFPIEKNRMSGYVAATGSLINIKDVYRIPADREYSFQADIDKKLDYRTMSTLVV
ncbi:GAF domain-containing protein, partial [candidate division KSB1 bacterium]